MKKLCTLLVIALGPAAIAACFALLTPQRSGAYNEYNNEYRKWPWRAGTEEYITTLPGNHTWPIEEAIDFGLTYETVNSPLPEGVVYDFDQYLDNCGGRMTITDLNDGTYITFCHLDAAYVSEDETVYQGKPVAKSGDTGIGAAHLHMQRDLQPYLGESVTLFPMAGYPDCEDKPQCLGLVESDVSDPYYYSSDNAGIGYMSSGTYYSAITAAYDRYGGQYHDGYGQVGVTWDPPGCGGACWWVHAWGAGITQDFIGPNRNQGDSGRRALMQGLGLGTAYQVSGGIWEKYKQLQWRGYPWMGYPTGEEGTLYGNPWQNFQCGSIGYDPGTGETYNTPNTDVARRPNGSQVDGNWASNPAQDKFGDDCDGDDDNDGLADSSDYNSSCPYRLNPDSDGDRYLDGYEVSQGKSPCNSSSKPGSTCTTDSDGDGFANCVESGGYGTSPTSTDSDGDGCADWIEIVDVNGNRSAEILDVLFVVRRFFNVIPASDSDPLLDVDKNGWINILDALLAAKNSSLVKANSCTSED